MLKRIFFTPFVNGFDLIVTIFLLPTYLLFADAMEWHWAIKWVTFVVLIICGVRYSTSMENRDETVSS